MASRLRLSWDTSYTVYYKNTINTSPHSTTTRERIYTILLATAYYLHWCKTIFGPQQIQSSIFGASFISTAIHVQEIHFWRTYDLQLAITNLEHLPTIATRLLGLPASGRGNKCFLCRSRKCYSTMVRCNGTNNHSTVILLNLPGS